MHCPSSQEYCNNFSHSILSTDLVHLTCSSARTAKEDLEPVVGQLFNMATETGNFLFLLLARASVWNPVEPDISFPGPRSHLPLWVGSGWCDCHLSWHLLRLWAETPFKPGQFATYPPHGCLKKVCFSGEESDQNLTCCFGLLQSSQGGLYQLSFTQRHLLWGVITLCLLK